MDEFYWITGAYTPGENGEWTSFAYGPFPDAGACEAVAFDDKAMLKALGSDTKDYEIDCTDPMTYGQACKHFEETIMSVHANLLLPEPSPSI